MKNNYQYQYYKPYCILLINPKGQIKKLHTPFKVKCIHSTDKIIKNTFLYVEQVHQGKYDEITYLINGKTYLHKYFSITINF